MSDLDFSNFEQEPQQKPKNNRSFMVIVGVLGAIILLALLAAAAYAILVLPGQNSARAKQAIEINAQNTATVMAATSSAMTAMAPTETPEPTATPEPSNTPLPTETPLPPVSTSTAVLGVGGASEDIAMTATVSSLLTQAAGTKPGANGTATTDPNAFGAGSNLTPTALPTTGFADEVGIPATVGLAFLCIVLILVTRQLRTARSR
jgi:hypothetical protein